MRRCGSAAARSGRPFVGQIDDLRLYNRALTAGEIEQLAIHYTVQVILSGVIGKRSKDDAADVRDYFLTYAAPEALRTAYAELKALTKEKDAFQKRIPTTMVMAEMEKPRDTFVLARGDYRNQTEKVSPACRRCCRRCPKDAPPNRLTLAQWLVDPGHPLTRASRSIASGRCTSAPASSRRRKTSARRASRRRIRSCSTGWPPSSSARAGTSGRCSG